MYEYDYSGNTERFQKMLDAAGVTREEFDIGNIIGVTYTEMKSIVDGVINRHNARNGGRT